MCARFDDFFNQRQHGILTWACYFGVICTNSKHPFYSQIVRNCNRDFTQFVSIYCFCFALSLSLVSAVFSVDAENFGKFMIAQIDCSYLAPNDRLKPLLVRFFFGSRSDFSTLYFVVLAVSFQVRQSCWWYFSMDHVKWVKRHAWLACKSLATIFFRPVHLFLRVILTSKLEKLEQIDKVVWITERV